MEKEKYNYFSQLEALNEKFNETQMLLEHSEKKLETETKKNKQMKHFANQYLGEIDTMASAIKELVRHFNPCFKGLS